ncbi:hypothetical protein [Vibrio nitrifigilis]|uniref:Uncharacterized protein n=1 Tax=Vibrio nitrifigilis TaxID=2789781 RepID=A0ABS0GJP0_9VIBR|nr:hypothetical protein [Vibrio nitrifigilis]MBF9000490.1 hypothetical protein [Vibrio nitrifigilis]MBF9001581.1 hypothetical protein [Vibrio nitrifigilis]MBF9002647.1 hypothetical protein [Vibrio nitrifigilis]
MCGTNSPVYYWADDDGYYVSIDGYPDYFRTRMEMYSYACDSGRDLIEVTPENEPDLRASGAFDNQGEWL